MFFFFQRKYHKSPNKLHQGRISRGYVLLITCTTAKTSEYITTMLFFNESPHMSNAMPIGKNPRIDMWLIQSGEKDHKTIYDQTRSQILCYLHQKGKTPRLFHCFRKITKACKSAQTSY